MHSRDPCNSFFSDLFYSNLWLSIQQPRTWNKVQYLDDGEAVPSEGDSNNLIWFQEMMAELPKPSYLQCLTVTKNKWCRFGCRFVSIIPGRSTSSFLNKFPIKWQCLNVETSWRFITLFTRVCIEYFMIDLRPVHIMTLICLRHFLPLSSHVRPLFSSFQVFCTIFLVPNYITVVIGLQVHRLKVYKTNIPAHCTFSPLLHICIL